MITNEDRVMAKVIADLADQAQTAEDERDALKAQLATATEAAEAARSQLAVAVEALDRISMFTPSGEFRTTGEKIVRQLVDEALAKLRAAKEER